MADSYLPEFDGTGVLIAPWAGEERRFRLAIGELRLLDSILREPPSVVIARLVDNCPRYFDVRHVILIGLIGGGMDRRAAEALVHHEIDEVPLVMVLTLSETAALILLAAISGPLSAGEDVESDVPDPVPAQGPRRLPFDLMIGNGAAMGFSPRDIDAMSLWEFETAQRGWVHAHGSESNAEPPPPSDARYEELMRDG